MGSRRNIAIILYTEEIGRAAFVNVFFLLGIQENRGRVAFVMGYHPGAHARCVVSSHLDMARSVGRRTVVFPFQHHLCCSETFFKIRSYGSNKHNKHILFGGSDTHLRAYANQQRTDIQAGSRLIGRYIFLIGLNRFYHSLCKQLDRRRLHHHILRRSLHAFCILFTTEQADFAVFSPECFHPFKSLLSVMQTRRCHVNTEHFRIAYFRSAPFAVPVITTDVKISL